MDFLLLKGGQNHSAGKWSSKAMAGAGSEGRAQGPGCTVRVEAKDITPGFSVDCGGLLEFHKTAVPQKELLAAPLWEASLCPAWLQRWGLGGRVQGTGR